MQPSRRLAVCLLSVALSAASGTAAERPPSPKEVRAAARLLGLDFTDPQVKMMLKGLAEQRQSFTRLRGVALANDVPPAYDFNPLPPGFQFPSERRPLRLSPAGEVKLPERRDDLAFYSVRQLAELVRTRQISSVELTRFFLARLKEHGPRLAAVITLLEARALAEAREADEEIAAGHYRGPLHGIPYGAKDLLTARGAPTTWGATPYREQVIDGDATVVTRLHAAGAVLVAKMSLGELAMDDTWFGGQTKNPWDLKQGSSGSSAGSAAATSAGLLPFAIGSETLGSIVSPSNRCGVTGVRPSYGRVSRSGAMMLSWSMDKLGPICREVEDCAVVLDAILGRDGLDPTVYDAPFNYDPAVDLKSLRIGYVKDAFDAEKDNKVNDALSLEALHGLGVELVPIALPAYPVDDMVIILTAEAAASFDDLTLSSRDALLVGQGPDNWPNYFRVAHFIPAVAYIQASRVRTLLIRDMARLMREVDVYVAPSLEGSNLVLTNLSGHPAVVMPNGFDKDGHPTSITFTGRLYDEARLLAVAKKWQDATGHHLKHPGGF